MCVQVGALLRKQIPARPPNPLPDNGLEFYDSGDDSSDSGLEDILGVGHSTCRAACMQVLTEHACKKGHGGQVGRACMQVQCMHVYTYIDRLCLKAQGPADPERVDREMFPPAASCSACMR